MVVDLTKTFDGVDKETLLKKIYEYEIGLALDFIGSYLTNRF